MTPRTSVRALLICAMVALVAGPLGAVPAGAQQATAQVVQGMKGLGEVWCGPDGTCLSVGLSSQDVGAVVVLRASGPSGPVRPVPGTTTLSSITCPASGSCIAVGSAGGLGPGVVVEVGRDGTPGLARPVPGVNGLLDVACPTATTCIATGLQSVDLPAYPYLGSVPRFTIIENGQPGPVRDFPRRTGRAIGIACPNATTCLAAFTGGFVVLRQIDGAWTTTVRFASTSGGRSTEEISCPSSTICYATAVVFISSGSGSYGVPAIMPVSADGVPGPLQALSSQSGNAYNISCVPGRACTVVGENHLPSAALAIDVVRGSPMARTLWPTVDDFVGVSCIAAATCGITGGFGNTAFFVWHGPVPV
ncbi:MAG TPA: hypothetical protein VHF00_04240 [Acidimicrobiales bacterium]|nr:hypothetical protein [Acidimicrobiales bacterium]